MKTWKLFVGMILLTTGMIMLFAFSFRRATPPTKARPFVPPQGCVFRTIMGEESSNNHAAYKTPEKVQRAVDMGLEWMMQAQQANGGWGAGSHRRQDIRNPHAVETDPATTAMVAMAMLRSGTTLSHGPYSQNLRRALDYLLQTVERTPVHSANITDVSGTQIQMKLGNNIDVILTSQFLSNVYDHLKDEPALRTRVKASQKICVAKIQDAQDANGSTAGSGWAGVLQSSFAMNALESAEAQGIVVDKDALARARQFQKNNYNAKTGDVNTDLGAGIVLYSITGSVRASAKEARKVDEVMQQAKREGKLSKSAAPTAENLQKIGYAQDEALQYATAYEVYQSAKVEAQREDVLSGFGNNGGEEFLSYLQTGESMVINQDDSWQNWYDNISGRILKIQNQDGSWHGHHCITSPVFCTATCLLILAIHNDVNTLMELGRR